MFIKTDTKRKRSPEPHLDRLLFSPQCSNSGKKKSMFPYLLLFASNKLVLCHLLQTFLFAHGVSQCESLRWFFARHDFAATSTLRSLPSHCEMRIQGFPQNCLSDSGHMGAQHILHPHTPTGKRFAPLRSAVNERPAAASALFYNSPSAPPG